MIINTEQYEILEGFEFKVGKSDESECKHAYCEEKVAKDGRVFRKWYWPLTVFIDSYDWAIYVFCAECMKNKIEEAYSEKVNKLTAKGK